MSQPLRTFNHFCQETFSTRLVKVSLDAGAPCPHRDLPGGGCVFCNPHAFSPDKSELPLSEQLTAGMAQMGKRYSASAFAAYFQDNTTTALPVEQLRLALTTAVDHPDVKMLFLGTRPDYLPPPVLDLLQEIGERKPLWVELGVQSTHDSTLQLLNRGHDSSCTELAIRLLLERNLPVVAHVILGLPQETPQMMRETLQKLQEQRIAGIKLHHLQVHCDTKLAEEYEAGRLKLLSFEQYLELLCELIPWLPPEAVIFRLFAESDPRLLIAPQWGMRRAQIYDRIYRELQAGSIRQGSAFQTEEKTD